MRGRFNFFDLDTLLAVGCSCAGVRVKKSSMQRHPNEVRGVFSARAFEKCSIVGCYYKSFDYENMTRPLQWNQNCKENVMDGTMESFQTGTNRISESAADRNAI